MRATVRKLVSDRGFGFIVIDGGESVFFHASDLWPGEFEALQVGDALDVARIEQSDRGMRARGITRA
jgi:cold shock CspA family protein